MNEKKTKAKVYEDLARAFLQQYSVKSDNNLVHRYRHYNGSHYFYERNCWKDVSTDELEFGIVRQHLMRIGIGSEDGMVKNVINTIKAIGHISNNVFPELPCWTGGENPFANNKHVISFKNGLLDLERYRRTEECDLQPHSPHWFSLNQLEFDFDPNAKCDRWITFLNEVYEGDQERIALLQEWFGYILTPDTRFHKMLILNGKKRSGKSTIQSIMQQLVNGNWTAFKLPTLASQFGLSPLMNSLLAIVSEVELGKHDNRESITEMLKAIVGGDPISVERKYIQGAITVKVPTRICVACNQLPNLYDNSGALSARLLIADHNVSFVGREDVYLQDKLKSEIAGICNWSLIGLIRLLQNGQFTTPEMMRISMQYYQQDESPVPMFLKDRCTIRTSLDPKDLDGIRLTDDHVWISKTDLFLAFDNWCTSREKGEQSRVHFGRNLMNCLPALKLQGETKKMVDGKQVMVYRGIDVLPEFKNTGNPPQV